MKMCLNNQITAFRGFHIRTCFATLDEDDGYNN
jgi:hypothetical protein